MPDRCKILTLLISAAFAWPVMAQSERGGVQLKYLGTAGWEITDGRTVSQGDAERYLRPGRQSTVV
jgi:hypothetical protein